MLRTIENREFHVTKCIVRRVGYAVAQGIINYKIWELLYLSPVAVKSAIMKPVQLITIFNEMVVILTNIG